MPVTLFEYTPTRSARVRWTLLELDIAFESRNDRSLFGTDELKATHPQGKLPAIYDNGRPLFESAAICAWLADKKPEAGMIAPSGDWNRALHDQWVAFTLSEIEAYLWSTARNERILPKAERVPAIVEQNERECSRGLEVLNRHLSERSYLINERFSVTDIIVSFSVNWASGTFGLDSYPHLQSYQERLLDMPLCPYEPK